MHFLDRPNKKRKKQFRKHVQPKLKATRSVVSGTLTIVQNFQDTTTYKKAHLKKHGAVEDEIDKFFDQFHDPSLQQIIPRQERMRREFIKSCLSDLKRTRNSRFFDFLEIINKLIDN